MSRRLPEELATSRLRLRAPVAADAAAIFGSYTQDPLVCRFMIWTPHRTTKQTEEFIGSCIDSWRTGDRLPYVITEKESDFAVGMIEARLQQTTIDIGYVLARAHWNKGFMPEAIGSLTSAALSDPETFRVQASCDTENIPSQRVLEKSGFSREGRLERYTVHPNISYEPRACFMYAKCK
jgi:[ribosomal protein S5]-alanine N-acetyltransferase